MNKRVNIKDLIKSCVTATSVKLLAQLSAYDPNITGIHFQHGHPLEIVKELQVLATGTTTRTERYPLVALFRDFPEQKGSLPGIYSEARINMIIATRTDPTYNSDKREQKSFDPIIRPIVDELFNQLELSGNFLSLGEDLQPYTEIEHFFWGRESVYGSQANIFDDWIDCTEIKDLILKPYTNNC